MTGRDCPAARYVVGGDSRAQRRTCSSYKLPLKWKTPPICHCEAPTGPWQSRAGTCSPYKPPLKRYAPKYGVERRSLRSRWRLCRLTDAACPLRVVSAMQTGIFCGTHSVAQGPQICHCEEAAGRRGALSAQREEVPLGCNLGKALTISPIAFPRCSRVLRDSHVASLLGMTNLEACQISAIFSKTRKLILDFFSIYVTI